MNVGVQVSVQAPAFCCLSPCVSLHYTFLLVQESTQRTLSSLFLKNSYSSIKTHFKSSLPDLIKQRWPCPPLHYLTLTYYALLYFLCWIAITCVIVLLTYWTTYSKIGAYFIHSSLRESLPSLLSELHKYWRTNISRTASVLCRPSLCENSKNISHHWLLLSTCANKRDLTNTEIWPQKQFLDATASLWSLWGGNSPWLTCWNAHLLT